MHKNEGRKDVIDSVEKVVTSLEVNKTHNAGLHLTSIYNMQFNMTHLTKISVVTCKQLSSDIIDPLFL
jgi:hypothetical protein